MLRGRRNGIGRQCVRLDNRADGGMAYTNDNRREAIPDTVAAGGAGLGEKDFSDPVYFDS